MNLDKTWLVMAKYPGEDSFLVQFLTDITPPKTNDMGDVVEDYSPQFRAALIAQLGQTQGDSWLGPEADPWEYDGESWETAVDVPGELDVWFTLLADIPQMNSTNVLLDKILS